MLRKKDKLRHPLRKSQRDMLWWLYLWFWIWRTWYLQTITKAGLRITFWVQAKDWAPSANEVSRVRWDLLMDFPLPVIGQDVTLWGLIGVWPERTYCGGPRRRHLFPNILGLVCIFPKTCFSQFPDICYPVSCDQLWLDPYVVALFDVTSGSTRDYNTIAPNQSAQETSPPWQPD